MTKSSEELKLERAKVQQQLNEIMEIASCYDKKEWNPSFRSLLEMTKAQLAYIDAALAEHADSATPVVAWEQRHGCYIHDDDGVNELRVYLWGDEWYWHTAVEYRANGTCATEAEAKQAAIAAARGLR